MLDAGNPIATVVIPCYNGAAFIRECVGSVLSQTRADIDVVIVDDGSTDGTAELVEDTYDDPRIRIVRHGVNRGIAAARNTGILEARGEFIGFIDQDDLWFPDKIEKQLNAFADCSADVGMVFSDVAMTDANGRRLGLGQAEFIPGNINELGRRDLLRAYFLHNFITLITALVRRECFDTIGLLDERIRGGMDDFEFCLRLLGEYRVHCLLEPLAAHRVHEGNYSLDSRRLLADSAAVSLRAVEIYPFLANLAQRRRAIHHYRLARYYRDAGDSASARLELRRAIKEDAGWLLPWLAYPLCALGAPGLRLLRLRRSMLRSMRRLTSKR